MMLDPTAGSTNIEAIPTVSQPVFGSGPRPFALRFAERAENPMVIRHEGVAEMFDDVITYYVTLLLADSRSDES